MASWGLDLVWRRRLVRELFSACPEKAVILDFGCGTGDLILEALEQNRRERKDLKVIGMDLSIPMMNLAREKVGTPPLFIQASCENLPLVSHSVDLVMSAFVLRNVRKIMAETLSEVRRVLKPGGTALLLEMGVPAVGILRPFHRIYLKTILPLIGRSVLGKAWSRDYLAETIFQFWSPLEYCRLLTDAGFRDARFELSSMGLAAFYICRK